MQDETGILKNYVEFTLKFTILQQKIENILVFYEWMGADPEKVDLLEAGYNISKKIHRGLAEGEPYSKLGRAPTGVLLKHLRSSAYRREILQDHFQQEIADSLRERGRRKGAAHLLPRLLQ